MGLNIDLDDYNNASEAYKAGQLHGKIMYPFHELAIEIIDSGKERIYWKEKESKFLKISFLEGVVDELRHEFVLKHCWD